jgi:uncharacterized protein YdeI (YjbR/CyaY-like superfamily)
MPARDSYYSLAPESTAEWREWLEANHSTAPGVWLTYAKKNAGVADISYEEAVEEALCYGWIDSIGRSLDGKRMSLVFTPRKPGGTWAKSNKERIARLIEEGRMTAAGLAKIEQAKADGSWNALDDFDDLDVPEDVQAALAADETAAANFAAFSPGVRRTYLWWIKTAKRPETRAKRIAETVRLVARNIKHPQRVARRE